MEKRAKILVLDDDPEFTTDLQAALEVRAYQVSFVNNMKQAQEMVCHDKPDLVILGRITPQGDEFRLHRWLKQNTSSRHLPVIVIDYPPEKQLARGWGDGNLWHDAENYFCRPIEPAALVPIIEKLLDKSTGKIKVLVADDHTLVRQAIHAAVNLQRDMHVVGEAENGREAVEKTHELQPDIVVMDMVMPKMNGLEATKQICQECKQVKVLVLTQYDNEQNVQAAYQAGALRVIPKKSAGSELIANIRAASREEQFKHPEVAGKIKVLVADDHGLVREGIHALVNLQGDMLMIGEASDGREAIIKTHELLPDVVLMDIVMPGMNGLEATKQIRQECKQVKVLMLTQYGDEENIRTAYQAGAFGFIHKRSVGSELTAGIRAVNRGEHLEHPVAV